MPILCFWLTLGWLEKSSGHPSSLFDDAALSPCSPGNPQTNCIFPIATSDRVLLYGVVDLVHCACVTAQWLHLVAVTTTMVLQAIMGTLYYNFPVLSCCPSGILHSDTKQTTRVVTWRC